MSEAEEECRWRIVQAFMQWWKRHTDQSLQPDAWEAYIHGIGLEL
jgi:hypothetical protein